MNQFFHFYLANILLAVVSQRAETQIFGKVLSSNRSLRRKTNKQTSEYERFELCNRVPSLSSPLVL